MFIIIKQGVYAQGVWIEDSFDKAEELREYLIEQDTDDYHEYVIWEQSLGCDVFSGVEVSSISKTIHGYFTVNIGNLTYYATTEDPDMTAISLDESMKFVHKLSGNSKYKSKSKEGNFYLKKYK